MCCLLEGHVCGLEKEPSEESQVELCPFFRKLVSRLVLGVVLGEDAGDRGGIMSG